MSFVPLKASELDTASIKFSPVTTMGNGGKTIYLNQGNGSKLYLKTPDMTVPFDSGDFDNNKYTVQVDLTDSCAEFRDKLKELDEVIIQSAMENSVSWFKKKNMSRDAIENVYRPMVKPHLDKDTGEPSEEYAPKFRFKIAKYDGRVKCRLFNKDKQEMNVNDPSKDDYTLLGIERSFEDRLTIPHKGIFKRGTQVKCLLRCVGIYLINGTFGCTWAAEQVQVKPVEGVDNYDFLDDSEEETEVGLPLVVSEENQLISSDEDDDSQPRMITRSVSSSPPTA
jgi:hypothetical protein